MANYNSSMFEQVSNKEENLFIFKEIESKPVITQRELSVKLTISLGKVNYLLRELIKKGLIEVKSFSDKPGKLNKLHYHITKEGLKYRINIVQHFLKEKENEYNKIRQEWEQLTFKEIIIANSNDVVK